MFRRFESLVDPYAPYAESDTPPDRLWPFLVEYLRPARRVMAWTIVSVFAVAVLEIALIWYAGRLVDVLGDTPPAEVWLRHGLELGAVAAFILVARPLIYAASAALLNQSLMPNVGTIVRWRSHRHVLRQSLGWFQNDFAGRIANRMMQTAPAVGELTFQTFDALVYAVIYLAGALWLLGDTDLRLGAAAGRLARPLRLADRLDRAARRRGVEGLLRRALGDHRPHRRQLHQHPVGQALRPHPDRGGLRRRGDRARAPDLHGADAADHGHGSRPDPDQRLPDRRRHRHRDRALAGRRRHRRHRRRRLGADAAAERDDRLDHVVAVVAVPEHRGDPRGHGDDRPADRAPRRARRPAARASAAARSCSIASATTTAGRPAACATCRW